MPKGLLALALHDDIFTAESLQTVRNIFQARIPSGRESLQLKIKRNASDVPVFCAPGRATNSFRTSPTEPLHSSIRLRYLTELGRRCGLERPFTQYCARRGLVNAVNSKLTLLLRESLWSRRTDSNLSNPSR